MNSVILLHVSVTSIDKFTLFVSFLISLCEGLFRQLHPYNTFATSLSNHLHLCDTFAASLLCHVTPL